MRSDGVPGVFGICGTVPLNRHTLCPIVTAHAQPTIALLTALAAILPAPASASVAAARSPFAAKASSGATVSAAQAPAGGATASGAARAPAKHRHPHRVNPNVLATERYIDADYTLVQTARANLPTSQAAINSLGERVSGECPLLAAQAPQNHDAEQLSDEVVGALEVAGYEADHPSMVAFADTIRGLRWSNRKLTRMVHAYATKLEGFPTLGIPDICADVAAWAGSGYRTLAAATVAFDKGFEAFSLEAEEVKLRLLRPYESATEASLLRRTKQLEEPLAEFEAEAVSDYSKILNALKLPQ